MTPPDHQTRLKMIRFRAWRRGFREADFIIGGFADRHLEALTDDQLTQFEVILDEPDQLVFAWIIGHEPAPDHVRGEVFEMLRAFKIRQDGLA